MDRSDEYRKLLEVALGDLAILSGDKAGSGTAWQDVAGTASVNLRTLAAFLDVVRRGETAWRGRPAEGPVVFASPAEVLEGVLQ
jgi:hypothetical protein